ncbi:MAG: hypothetical protein ABIO70_27065 [Pseudomonadota bacterium]
MSRKLLFALLFLTSCGGVKVIRTPEYRKLKAMPPDLGIVLAGDATFEWNKTTKRRENEVVGTSLCPRLVHYLRSTDTFGLVSCVVVPAANVGPERELEEGGRKAFLPEDGASFALDRRTPAAVLIIQDLKVLNDMTPDDREAKSDWTATKLAFPVFGSFAWWDNQQGALIAWGALDGQQVRAGTERGEPRWDDVAWDLTRWMGDGMPFKFTW